MAGKKSPPCTLRKPCGYCNKPYGRKGRKNNKNGRMHLQSIVSWKESETCSQACDRKLKKKRRQEERENKIRYEEALNIGYALFTGVGR